MSSLNIWKFMVHILLKSGLENFEDYLTSVWDECNCVVVWAFFGIAFLWGWNENWPFPVLWPLLQFSSVQFSHSVVFNSLRSMNCSMPGLPVHHQLPSSLRLMSIESVMPSSHLILCRPLLPPSILPILRVFANDSVLHIRWPKYWSFSFSISPSNGYSELISFRMDL